MGKIFFWKFRLIVHRVRLQRSFSSKVEKLNCGILKGVLKKFSERFPGESVAPPSQRVVEPAFAGENVTITYNHNHTIRITRSESHNHNKKSHNHKHMITSHKANKPPDCWLLRQSLKSKQIPEGEKITKRFNLSDKMV